MFLDIEKVNHLISLKLSVDEFTKYAHQLNPDLIIVEPHMPATADLRFDHSRLFIMVNDGIVVGGSFG